MPNRTDSRFTIRPLLVLLLAFWVASFSSGAAQAETPAQQAAKPIANAPATAKSFDSAGFRFSVAPTPDWVETLAMPTANNNDKPAPLQYAIVDRQTRVDTSIENYRRYAMQPNQSGQINSAAELEIRFSPVYQQLTIHFVDVIRNGERRTRLVPEQIKLVQREKDIERSLYDGSVTAFLLLDDIQVGDIVDYAYTIRGQNPVFDGKYFSGHKVAWKTPVFLSNVRVVAAKNRRIHHRLHKLDNDALQQTTLENGDQVFSVKLSNPALVPNEDDQPLWFYPYPFVEFSEFDGWQDVQSWAAELYGIGTNNNTVTSAALAVRIEKIKSSSASAIERLKLAMQLVQDEVRYFGVELGQNSHRPSDPNDVFERRYGDCKDKTQLLAQVLRAMDIETWPVLISTSEGKGIGTRLPSPGIFDHVINVAKIDGKHYWLDGTRNYQLGPVEQWPSLWHFGLGLVVDGKQTELATVGNLDNPESKVEILESYVGRAYNRPVDFYVHSRYTGQKAASRRRNFSSQKHSEIAKNYVNFYARAFPDIEQVEAIRVKDSPDDNLFEVFEHYRIPNYWELKKDQPNKLHFDLYGRAIRHYVGIPSIIRRKTPLALSHRVSVEMTTMVTFPQKINFKVDEPTEIRDPAFVYRKTEHYQGHSLTIHHSYKSLSETVQPEALAAHLKRRKAVRTALDHGGWVGFSEADTIDDSSSASVRSVIEKLAESISAPPPTTQLESK